MLERVSECMLRRVLEGVLGFAQGGEIHYTSMLLGEGLGG